MDMGLSRFKRPSDVKPAARSSTLSLEEMLADFNRITRDEQSNFSIGSYGFNKNDSRNFYARILFHKGSAELNVTKTGATLLDVCMELHMELRTMGLL